jgi:hypothetical protein
VPFRPDERSRPASCQRASLNRKKIPGGTQGTTGLFPQNNWKVIFVIGFGPTERPSECIVSIAAAANGAGLCFIHGASLPDPGKVLLGSGKQTRFVRLSSADVLQQPAVQRLLTIAADRAKTSLPASGRGRLIIRSVSAKQRAPTKTKSS